MNPVPKSIASISKELIKLHIEVDDIVSFNGFGPWMKPAGFEPPQLPIEKPKKKKRKEPITLPLAKDKKEPVEGELVDFARNYILLLNEFVAQSSKFFKVLTPKGNNWKKLTIRLTVEVL